MGIIINVFPLQLILILSSASIIISLSDPPNEFNYPAVFNFGDSNSDTGELAAGLGFQLVPPHGETFFGKPSGRFCDGRQIVDFLTNATSLPFLNPYLEAVGAPSFHTGCNFAAGGSTISPATANSISPFSFGIQVGQFLRFKARVLDLLSYEGEKYSKHLPAENYFHTGLYMLDIGQNDLAGSFYSKTYDQVVALIPTFLAEFEAGIKRLYDQGGARNFWIHNTGPLGCLAQVIAKFGTDISKLDKIGCVSTHNQAAKVFNQQLHDLCRKIKGQYKDAISVTYVDIYTIKYNLISNYTRYGFEHPIMVCCGYGGPPLNYDSRVGCGRTVVVNATSSITANSCNESSKYVSWDGIHYTDAANQHVASQILTGMYSDHRPFFKSRNMPLFMNIILF